MDFSITILGSNSAAPAHGRNQTSQVVTWGKHSFLLDCGESTQHQLRRFKVKYFKINHIFISHLHGDHYLGLMGLLGTYHLNNRKNPLHLYGPKGLDEIITVQLKYSGTLLKFPLVFHLVSVTEKTRLLDLEDLEIHAFPLKHRIPCTGFSFEEKTGRVKLRKELIRQQKPGLEAIRTLLKAKDVRDMTGKVIYKAADFCQIKAPRKYAFCSDTAFDPSLTRFIQGVDLLYHETTFMEAEKERAKQTRHSTTKEAAEIANLAAVKKLLLGHYSVRYSDLQPLLLEAREVFPNSFLSEEGSIYPIP
ncbi:ribonuclease Z [Cyclobacterium jeungdonense]|uniref:Ribonuclease Z n=1 Tax=Cyclobacterium jeungdonense TaxID=708087 RepID=A0ABT8C7H7_9BACT|nr:ribonuclease Z [Cyclobacterium jeungdonense]MDN3688466.1 ribonuclease Z [Cyclobacterium jeungdonense]